MPFDQSTFAGFVGMLVNGLTTGLTYLITTTTIASLILSMGLFLRSFYTHFQSMMRNMDALVDGNSRQADISTPLKAYLIEAINFHNQAK